MPEILVRGPFHRSVALREGLPARVLEGTRFVRVHTCVYRHRDHVMSQSDLIQAARLALPECAQLTGLTRIQELGLDFGPLTSIRFVVARDLHLILDGVFLHRTKRLPPTDDVGGAGPAPTFRLCGRHCSCASPTCWVRARIGTADER